MARQAPSPATPLGCAVQERRGGMSQEDAARTLGLTGVTFSRIERGLHRPTYDTALKLARWLGEGWTVERVMEAARA
jgi:transcriptional regulator with XRE-family HTH domain